jgi:tetratricopeptide (TPR) repeat protein
MKNLKYFLQFFLSIFLILNFNAYSQEDMRKIAVRVISFDTTGKILHQGSGVIINQLGIVITNDHLYDSTMNFRIITSREDINDYSSVIARNELKDFIILKSDSDIYTDAIIANSDSIQDGQKVFVNAENLIEGDSMPVGTLKEIFVPYRFEVRGIDFVEENTGSAVFNENGELLGILDIRMFDTNLVAYLIDINDILATPMPIFARQKVSDSLTNGNAFEKGLYAMDNGDYKKAIQIWNDYLKTNPDDPVALNNLGDCYYEISDNAKAVECLTKAISLKKDYEDAYYNRGLAYQAIKEYKKSIADFDKVILLNPKFADAYRDRGWSKRLSGDDSYIEDFNYAIQLEPNKFPDIYSELGIRAYKKQSDEDALEYYTKVIQIQTKVEGEYGLANAYYQRAFANWNLGNREQACADWNKARELGKVFDKVVEEFLKYNCR